MSIASTPFICFLLTQTQLFEGLGHSFKWKNIFALQIHQPKLALQLYSLYILHSERFFYFGINYSKSQYYIVLFNIKSEIINWAVAL